MNAQSPVAVVTGASRGAGKGIALALGAAGYVPVVATVTPRPDDVDVFLNVNADMAVAPIAQAWDADTVLFLSDVPHVRDGAERIPHLDGAAATELEARGVIAGGMIPKVEAAVAAAEARPAATVKIAAGDVDDPVASALLPDRGTLVGAHSPEIHHA